MNIIEIKEKYNFESNLKTLRELARYDARLYCYSKYDIKAYGDLKDIPDNYKHYFEKYTYGNCIGPCFPPQEKSSFIQYLLDNSKVIFDRQSTYFQFLMPKGFYLLNNLVLIEEFGDCRNPYISKNTLDVIMPRPNGITVRGSLPFDLRFENIITDQMEVLSHIGPTKPDPFSEFGNAFEETPDEWTARHDDHVWVLAKDFSYIKLPYQDEINLIDIKREIFRAAFEIHCERDGKMFRSGEVMNSIQTKHGYKGLSDYLDKNQDIKHLFKQVNSRGFYKLTIPVFSQYIREKY